jgi:ABC-type lipoprotein export system ATPase subunit
MSPSPFIAFHGVSKTYRRGAERIDALRDVTFEAQQGQIVRLVGPSGSGKTTLLNLTAALDRPDRGDIIVASENISGLSRAKAASYRNARIGFVFQAYNLLPQLTALENVILPMIPMQRSDCERALELLDSVGLAARRNHRPSQLSGGEQQRVAIARALANDPPLILADEPTGNLDDETARTVMALLYASCTERGRTLLLVTHARGSLRPNETVLELRAGSLARPRDDVLCKDLAATHQST